MTKKLKICQKPQNKKMKNKKSKKRINKKLFGGLNSTYDTTNENENPNAQSNTYAKMHHGNLEEKPKAKMNNENYELVIPNEVENNGLYAEMNHIPLNAAGSSITNPEYKQIIEVKTNITEFILKCINAYQAEDNEGELKEAALGEIELEKVKLTPNESNIKNNPSQIYAKLANTYSKLLRNEIPQEKIEKTLQFLGDENVYSYQNNNRFDPLKTVIMLDDVIIKAREEIKKKSTKILGNNNPKPDKAKSVYNLNSPSQSQNSNAITAVYNGTSVEEHSKYGRPVRRNATTQETALINKGNTTAVNNEEIDGQDDKYSMYGKSRLLKVKGKPGYNSILTNATLTDQTESSA